MENVQLKSQNQHRGAWGNCSLAVDSTGTFLGGGGKEKGAQRSPLLYHKVREKATRVSPYQLLGLSDVIQPWNLGAHDSHRQAPLGLPRSRSQRCLWSQKLKLHTAVPVQQGWDVAFCFRPGPALSSPLGNHRTWNQ